MSSLIESETDRVAGVILDWAGTAVDHGCIGPVAVFLEAFEREGVKVGIDEARGPMGMMKRDHIVEMCRMPSVRERWRSVHGREPEERDIDAMYAFTEPRMIEAVAEHSEPIAGVPEFADELRRRGIKIGSTTGYTRSIMDVVVRRAKERGYSPDAIITSDEVPQGRPAPYMCYAACIEMQVYPFAAMIKIGDTVSDILEGRNAGMWTVGVSRTGNELGLSATEVAKAGDLSERLSAVEKKLKDAGAHYVVESAADCLPIVEAVNERLKNGERP